MVGVNVNPAPDAHDRLRRLFTILARVMEDDPDPLETNLSGDDSEEGGA